MQIKSITHDFTMPQNPVKGLFADAGFLRSGAGARLLLDLACAGTVRFAFGTGICLDLAAAACLSTSAVPSAGLGGDLSIAVVASFCTPIASVV